MARGYTCHRTTCFLPTFWIHFSICACHPCAGAILIFSVLFQFYLLIVAHHGFSLSTPHATRAGPTSTGVPQTRRDTCLALLRADKRAEDASLSTPHATPAGHSRAPPGVPKTRQLHTRHNKKMLGTLARRRACRRRSFCCLRCLQPSASFSASQPRASRTPVLLLLLLCFPVLCYFLLFLCFSVLLVLSLFLLSSLVLVFFRGHRYRSAGNTLRCSHCQ